MKITLLTLQILTATHNQFCILGTTQHSVHIENACHASHIDVQGLREERKTEFIENETLLSTTVTVSARIVTHFRGHEVKVA